MNLLLSSNSKIAYQIVKYIDNSYPATLVIDQSNNVLERIIFVSSKCKRKIVNDGIIKLRITLKEHAVISGKSNL